MSLSGNLNFAIKNQFFFYYFRNMLETYQICIYALESPNTIARHVHV